MSVWTDKEVLITGGTGYLGSHLIDHLQGQGCRKIAAFARDPHKHEELGRKYPEVRQWVGDVRDKERLGLAMEDADVVIHAAAMKSVQICEYNPADALSINVEGAKNVLTSAYHHKCRVVFISSDKACEPANLYGKTKALAEHITLAYNAYRPLYSAVRYGNVMGSTGSVLPVFMEMIKQGAQKLPVTDPRATRFWVDMEDAIYLIEEALRQPPGQLVIGEHPSFRMDVLARAFDHDWETVGLKKGEKMHETLRSSIEGEEYTSDGNSWWLSEEEIRGKLHTLYPALAGDRRGKAIRSSGS